MNDRTRWILATICILCSALSLDAGWTFPFITIGILSIDIVKLTLPPLLSICAVVFLILAVLLIRKTVNPTLELRNSENSVYNS